MNRKEFLKMVAISPIVLLMNRLLGTFKSDEVVAIQKIGKDVHTWKFQLPFGMVYVSRYQWEGEERTAYYITHKFGDKDTYVAYSDSWAILPECGMVGDTTKWKYLDMSQEDIDAYMTTGRKWIPGHFEVCEKV